MYGVDMTRAIDLEKWTAAEKLTSRRTFTAAFIVALATVIVPPYFRLLGSDFWTLFDLNEAQWSVVSALRGLIGIYEMLINNDQIRHMIMQEASAGALRRRARLTGMATLHEDSWRKVQSGITTVEEVLRVTQVDEPLLAENGVA